MADIIDSSRMVPADFTDQERLWLYNAMDSVTTLDIHNHQLPLVEARENAALIYAFELAQCGMAAAMEVRGVKVDQVATHQLVDDLRGKIMRTNYILQALAGSLWDVKCKIKLGGDYTLGHLNPRSSPMLQSFFYDLLRLPKQYKIDKGERKISCDRNSLEKLKMYFRAEPFINCIFKIRDLEGFLKVLLSGIDSDGRMRCSFNPGATETGRWSSSKNCFAGGTNLQNITKDMRHIFVADEGMKLAYPDLQQAESRVVAYESGDERYIEACESEDLHTYVARLLWPRLDWTGSIREDTKVAEQPFYRHFSFRDMAKRAGHASNYYATPFTVARALKIEKKVAEEFHDAYFGAFPGIKTWWAEIQRELQSTGHLTTPLGRRRGFYGRLTDDSTLREAIAQIPQSTVADLCNLGLYRIWREFDLTGRGIQMLGQGHDAGLLQYPEDDPEVLDQAVDLMRIPIEIRGRTMVIPVDCKVGYDWHNLAPFGSEDAAAQKRPLYLRGGFSLLDAPLGAPAS